MISMFEKKEAGIPIKTRVILVPGIYVYIYIWKMSIDTGNSKFFLKLVRCLYICTINIVTCCFLGENSSLVNYHTSKQFDSLVLATPFS